MRELTNFQNLVQGVGGVGERKRRERERERGREGGGERDRQLNRQQQIAKKGYLNILHFVVATDISISVTAGENTNKKPFPPPPQTQLYLHKNAGILDQQIKSLIYLNISQVFVTCSKLQSHTLSNFLGTTGFYQILIPPSFLQ